MNIRFVRHYHTDKGILYCNLIGTELVPEDVNGFEAILNVPVSHGQIQLDPENCYISNLSVSDNSRRRGIGDHTLSALESEAKSAGCDHVALIVEKGTFMQDWYSRRGYEAYSEEVIEEVPMVWMRKELKMDEQ